MNATSTTTRTLALALAPAVAVVLLLLSFAGVGTSTGPRDVPVAVVGPPAAADAFADSVDPDGGALDVSPAADVDTARDLVLDREVYGAFVLEQDGPGRLLVASAASPAVASLLTDVATRAGVDDVVDVAPTPPDDPRGAGLAGGALPFTVAGIVAGTLMALLVRGRRQQLLGVAAASVLAGVAAVAILHGWLGSLAGNPVAEAGTVALGVVAIATLLLGAHAVAGRAGLVVVDLLLVLVGNPLSGATAAPELLPAGLSAVGHRMPLGATVDALRGVSGFDGAASGTPLLVLTGWIALGLVLLALRRTPTPDPEADDVRPHRAREVVVAA